MAPDDRLLYLRFCGDATFVAPTRYLLKQMKAVSAPASRYHFDYVLEALAGAWPGAFHAGEVPFVFDRLRPVTITEAQSNARQKSFGIEIEAGTYRPSQRDLEVASTVHNLWVQFAKTGDPNGPGLPEWPMYTEEGDTTLLISNEKIGSVRGLHKARLDLIEADYIERRKAALADPR
jgi:para-nitrobenzyl esterase